MKIAIASGKGGTGKTTVASNLALSGSGRVCLLDCDVEEPNCHIFLGPITRQIDTVSVPIPQVDEEKCNACGECGRVCEYAAIVSLKTRPLLFPEMCHGCGACARVCPTGAITEVQRPIGVIESVETQDVLLIHGRLNVGEAMAPPLIRAVKRHASTNGTTIIDVPPGTSCPAVTALRGTDFAVLVTEPTPFGLNDLVLAVETVRRLGMPFGVVINRADLGDERVIEYCRQERVPVLLSIPDDRRVAEAYSEGRLIVEAVPGYRDVFEELLSVIRGRVNSKEHQHR